MTIRIWVFSAAVLALVACAPALQAQATCRHTSLYAASVAGEQYPVRMVMGWRHTSDQGHIQAQAFIDGRWRWLSVWSGKIRLDTRDDGFWPEYDTTYSAYWWTWYTANVAPQQTGVKP